MNSRTRTLLAAGAVVAAGGVAVGYFRSRGPWQEPGHDAPELGLAASEWAEADAWFAAARVAARGAAEPGTGGREVYLCSVVPGKPATCAHGRGATWADAARTAASGHDWLAEGTLRLDLVLATTPTWFPDGTSDHQVGTRGLRVGERVVLPSDVLLQGLFRPQKEDGDPVWRLADLQRALGVADDEFRFDALTTFTLVQSAPGLAPIPVYRLHRRSVPATDPLALAEPLRLSGEHLLRLVSAEGRIRYRFDPRSGKELAGQNLLRHAGTTWSLLRAYERFDDPRYLEAAERAIGFLLRHSGTDTRTGPHGGGRGRFVVEGSHHKLGGAGLALLSLATWQAASGRDTYAEPAGQYATWLLSQQLETGEFVSFAAKVEGGPPKNETSAYYPGEAVLGLVTWYERDPDPRWLDTARRGADWLIDVRDAGKGPAKLDADHWLMMALERLHRATGDERYVDHAIRLADAVLVQQGRQKGHDQFHPDYLGGFYEPPRTTPATIRAEGLGAVLDLCDRTDRDCARFVPALHLAVSHALQAQFGADDLWWTPRPDEVLGGFAGGIFDPELRNDYTQHAFCAVLAAERHPLPPPQ